MPAPDSPRETQGEQHVDEALYELVQRDPRYPVAAYEFICEALESTQDWLDRTPTEDDDPDTDYHISAEELCTGACLYAVHEFGLMAPAVFQQWNLNRTDDIGQLVTNLISIERIAASERDDPSDFENLFVLPDFMDEQFRLNRTINQHKGGR
jgi:uncharacterized repeat protein (TIGR04138 family)